MEPEIEQAIAVVDLNGFSPMQADLEFVCFVVDVIHNYYPRRFARVLMVDAPQMFESFWRSVCPMLHHYQDGLLTKVYLVKHARERAVIFVHGQLTPVSRFLSPETSVYMCIYIYIYLCVCVCLCIC